METSNLIVERTISSIKRQAFDDRVEDFASGLSERRLQQLHVRQCDRPKPIEIVAVSRVSLGDAQTFELSAVRMSAKVLSVDEEQRGLRQNQGLLSCQDGIRRPPRHAECRSIISSVMRRNAYARRSVQRRCPSTSAI